MKKSAAKSRAETRREEAEKLRNSAGKKFSYLLIFLPASSRHLAFLAAE